MQRNRRKMFAIFTDYLQRLHILVICNRIPITHTLYHRVANVNLVLNILTASILSRRFFNEAYFLRRRFSGTLVYRVYRRLHRNIIWIVGNLMAPTGVWDSLASWEFRMFIFLNSVRHYLIASGRSKFWRMAVCSGNGDNSLLGIFGNFVASFIFRATPSFCVTWGKKFLKSSFL